ncbi:HpcH/HpaI aldolase family protein [Albimonas pacifica]|uniref:4-hydroxy-2-oxoheptanedioate aldolase n=1 Tax=Albimonas pacifica TaxID=1114924 RepID=A0A1I3FEF0_9RHOB|nr:aldolase/citrate lyase family protein [Albimonas pacifica]SFI09588.1 4-hydroxy-2-oxoheptanedioate aldolase [Albimonas pacifica]
MKFRDKLADPARALSIQFATIPSPVVTQAIAAAGADGVLIDMEHGAVDWATCHAMIAATQGFDCSPAVRISKIDEAECKRALDMGAEGICFPFVNTPEDAARCVAALRYPPEGTRGWGPFLASSRWDAPLFDYQPRFGDRPYGYFTLETAQAAENAQAILATPGVDIAVMAAFDLSSDLGLAGRFDHPDFLAAAKKIEDAALAAGVPLAGGARDEAQIRAMKARGYRIFANFDVLMLKAAAAAQAGWVRG